MSQTPPAWHLRLGRYYLGEQSDLRSERLRHGDVVFDIGAHNGYFTTKASELVGHRGYVVAVEASLTNYRLVQKMATCNGLHNIKLVYSGVASLADGEPSHSHLDGVAEKTAFSTVGHASSSPSSSSETSLSAVGPTIESQWVRRQDGSIVDILSNASRTVSSVSVDDLVDRLRLPRVDHIFATVNGIEIDALNGAVRSIAQYAPEVVVTDRYVQHTPNADKTLPALRSWLVQHGYRYFRHGDLPLGTHGGYDNGTLFASRRMPFLPSE